jgi:hypothetical protein
MDVAMTVAKCLTCIFLLGLNGIYMLQVVQARQVSLTEKLESAAYQDTEGTTYKIEPGSVKVSIVTPQVLYKRLREPFMAEIQREEAIDICLEQFDRFTCQSIYGLPSKKLPAEPPRSLLSLNIPIAFTNISYKAIAQKKNGTQSKPIKDSINCLNREFPNGYWVVARKSTNIVNNSNLRLDLKNPANRLKVNICNIIYANIDYLEKLME